MHFVQFYIELDAYYAKLYGLTRKQLRTRRLVLEAWEKLEV